MFDATPFFFLSLLMPCTSTAVVVSGRQQALAVVRSRRRGKIINHFLKCRHGSRGHDVDQDRRRHCASSLEIQYVRQRRVQTLTAPHCRYDALVSATLAKPLACSLACSWPQASSRHSNRITSLTLISGEPHCRLFVLNHLGPWSAASSLAAVSYSACDALRCPVFGLALPLPIRLLEEHMALGEGVKRPTTPPILVHSEHATSTLQCARVQHANYN